jgi:phospholipid-binding lipoprotein MlaA
MLQGEFDRAEDTFGRFMVNTVVGIGGLFDAATGLGLEYHNEDVGQTLAVHGVGDGPYLMLPLFGPSNVRDGTGRIVEWLIDPVNIIARNQGREDLLLVRSAADAVDARYRNLDLIDDLQYNSLDFYAAVRSFYRQKRKKDISNTEIRAKRKSAELREEQRSTVPPTPTSALLVVPETGDWQWPARLPVDIAAGPEFMAEEPWQRVSLR